MDEETARTKECPWVQISTSVQTGRGCCGLVGLSGIDWDDPQYNRYCNGSTCPMWRWISEGREGYCELTRRESSLTENSSTR
jgi:hypothetical protein